MDVIKLVVAEQLLLLIAFAAGFLLGVFISFTTNAGLFPPALKI